MRVNISIDERVLTKFDEVAKELGETRSHLIQVLMKDLTNAKSVPSGDIKNLAKKYEKKMPALVIKEINKAKKIAKVMAVQKEMKKTCPVHGGMRMGMGYTCCDGL